MKDKESFTRKVKEELCGLTDTFSKEETISLLYAFLSTNGTISIGGNNNVSFKTEIANVIKFIYKLIKEYFPYVETSFSFVKQMKLYKATEFKLNIIEGGEEFLNELQFDILSTKIPAEIQNSEEKIRSFMTGLFLGTGSCNSPETSNYHLEFSVRDEGHAKAILKMMNKIKSARFDFKPINRRNRTVLYLKRSDLISMFLAYINANDCCIEFENIRVDRDFSNSANRLLNCDVYNYNKSINKSKEILEDIQTIENALGGLQVISNEKVRELCILKKENPEASYDDLASLLTEKLEKNVSKSNISHLIRKIKQMAEDYRRD